MIKRDEIYLASFPFGDKAGMKLRPVLTLTGTMGVVPEVLVAYISSVVPPSQLPTDILIDPTVDEYKSMHLRVPSVLRLHKLATIHASSIVRRLGSLAPAVRNDVEQNLRHLLGL